MKLAEILAERSQSNCELCGSGSSVKVYEVPPQEKTSEHNCIMVCSKCLAQVEKKEPLDSSHWNCLATAMWTEVAGVQVVSWRMLNRLRDQSWAADLLDILYLDEQTLAWAKATGDADNDGEAQLHKDANGNILQQGDTVILTKSLDVKGTSLNAKLGTVVKNIRLVENNTEQIEGKIEGQVIVILTKYVRKQG